MVAVNLLKWFWYTPEKNGFDKLLILVKRNLKQILDKPRCEFEVILFFLICEMEVLFSMVHGNWALVQISCSHLK